MVFVRDTSIRRKAGLLLAAWFCALTTLSAVTLDQLRTDPDLTPKKFARYFSDFDFAYHHEIQAPEVFLATRSGDCDDYAALAAQVLGEKGYTTRLITVRMEDAVHMVCLVKEEGRYLDYNNRHFWFRTVKTDGTLRDIADQVAESFDKPWTSVSESIYDDGYVVLQATLAHPDMNGVSLSQAALAR